MPVLDAIGWKATGLWNRLNDRLWERRLGIATMGRQDANQPDAGPYSTFAYSSIMKVLDRLDIQPGDVLVDIGCGKGRIVCCAALRRANRIIGVDIEQGLCEIARANAARLRAWQSTIEIANMSAADFDYRDCTLFFLFNPFGAATLRQVLDAISQTLVAHPRPVRLAYVNPLHEQVLHESSTFEKYDQWLRSPWSGLKFDVSFWRSGHA